MILDKEKVITNFANKMIVDYLNENKYKANLEFIDDINIIKNRGKELKKITCKMPNDIAWNSRVNKPC